MKYFTTYRIISYLLVMVIVSVPFALRPYLVLGSSMDTTLSDRDILLVDYVSLYFLSPKRGELLVFNNPHQPAQVDIKRVIGLPGETVHVFDSEIAITDSNGIEERFLQGSLIGGGTGGENIMNFDMYLGPEDYFVLGDNRPTSLDSRLFGAVQQGDFIGRPVMRLWPHPELLAISF